MEKAAGLPPSHDRHCLFYRLGKKENRVGASSDMGAYSSPNLGNDKLLAAELGLNHLLELQRPLVIIGMVNANQLPGKFIAPFLH